MERGRKDSWVAHISQAGQLLVVACTHQLAVQYLISNPDQNGIQYSSRNS